MCLFEVKIPFKRKKMYFNPFVCPVWYLTMISPFAMKTCNKTNFIWSGFPIFNRGSPMNLGPKSGRLCQYFHIFILIPCQLFGTNSKFFQGGGIIMRSFFARFINYERYKLDRFLSGPETVKAIAPQFSSMKIQWHRARCHPTFCALPFSIVRIEYRVIVEL